MRGLLNRWLLAVLLLLAAVAVRAEPVPGLFEAAVPVAGQDPASRDQAMRAALAAVLVKVAGSTRVLENPGVTPALAGASSRVLQFYFKRDTLLPGDPPDAVPGLLLHASFQPADIETILRAAGEPILPPNRPASLLWLLVEDESGALLANADAAPALVAVLQREALRRGVPLLFPLLDLEDGVAVTPDTLRNLDAAAVLAASKRYTAQSVVIGRVQKVGEGDWQAEWQQHTGEDMRFAQARGVDVAEIGRQLVDALAEGLSAQFAIAAGSGSGEELRLRVDGVTTLDAYRRLLQLLKGLASVRGVELVLVERDSFVFALQSDATRDNLLSELSFVSQLASAGDPQALRYRWAGSAP